MGLIYRWAGLLGKSEVRSEGNNTFPLKKSPRKRFIIYVNFSPLCSISTFCHWSSQSRKKCPFFPLFWSSFMDFMGLAESPLDLIIHLWPPEANYGYPSAERSPETPAASVSKRLRCSGRQGPLHMRVCGSGKARPRPGFPIPHGMQVGAFCFLRSARPTKKQFSSSTSLKIDPHYPDKTERTKFRKVNRRALSWLWVHRTGKEFWRTKPRLRCILKVGVKPH